MSTGVTTADKTKTQLGTVKGWLESPQFKEQIARAIPKHMTADRFMRIAITATMKTPKLLQCTQESLFNCLLSLSQMGLEPDGRRAHLIPYEHKKTGIVECTLIVDYKGKAELVMRSGLVSFVHADVVCDKDEFEFDRGAIIKHKINFREPRGDVYAAYAVIRFKDGTEKCEVMSKSDILAIRDRSQGWLAFKNGYAKQSPWNPAEPVIESEMLKKTVFHRCTKWVPLSPEIRDGLELEDDEEVRIRDVGEATVVQHGTKSDALAEILTQRLQNQESDEVDTGEVIEPRKENRRKKESVTKEDASRPENGQTDLPDDRRELPKEVAKEETNGPSTLDICLEIINAARQDESNGIVHFGSANGAYSFQTPNGFIHVGDKLKGKNSIDTEDPNAVDTLKAVLAKLK